ncbi:MAG: DUF371 domain-containing protein [Thermoprotei archaeon]|nr:MAG: DUF371 domain-containing protein [Thermoprotei archaeon]
MASSTRPRVAVAVDVVEAVGHPNVRATHRSTLEVTKEGHLTERGNCILAVRASKGARDLSDSFKELARHDDSLVVALLLAGDAVDALVARGSRRLEFSDPMSIVIRRGEYVDGRTVAVRSSKAARDIDRGLVARLRSSKARLTLVLLALRIEGLRL